MRTGVGRFLTFKTHGYRLRFYPTDLTAELWYDPEGRATDVAFLSAYLKPGECFVDVGANVGTTAIAGALAVGSGGEVLAFEPHPRIFRYLVKNCRLNRLTNVVARNVAVGSSAGCAGFSDDPSDDRNRVLEESRTGMNVDVAPLDSFVSDFAGISLIKIDVEGYEGRVLAGAAAALARTSGIYIEIAQKHLQLYGASPVSVLDTLSQAGFHLLRWCDGALELLTPQNLPPFARHENVVAVRSVNELRQRLDGSFRVVSP
jgi:FkbM family methyltransferase